MFQQIASCLAGDIYIPHGWGRPIKEADQQQKTLQSQRQPSRGTAGGTGGGGHGKSPDKLGPKTVPIPEKLPNKSLCLANEIEIVDWASALISQLSEDCKSLPALASL